MPDWVGESVTELTRARIAVICSSRISREALCQLLKSMGFVVVSAGRTAAEAVLHSASDHAPNLLIHSITSEADAAQAAAGIQEMRSARRDLKVVILGDGAHLSAIGNILQFNVEALLSKDISADVLRRSLELIMLGQRMFPTLMPPLCAPSASPLHGPMALSPVRDAGQPGPRQEGQAVAGRYATPLSRREFEILRCLIDGMPNKMIARTLGITEATVKVHVKGLLRKTRLANRTQAAIWALNNSLGDPQDQESCAAGSERNTRQDEGRECVARSTGSEQDRLRAAQG